MMKIKTFVVRRQRRLGKIGEPAKAIVPALMEAFNNDKEAEVQKAAARALAVEPTNKLSITWRTIKSVRSVIERTQAL